MAAEIIKFSILLSRHEGAEGKKIDNTSRKIIQRQKPTQQGVEYFMHFIGDFYS